MAEENKVEDLEKNPIEEKKNIPDSVPYARFKEVNDKFRDLEKKTKEIEDKEREAEEAKLIEDGKQEELIKQLTSERDGLNLKVENLSKFRDKRREAILSGFSKEDQKELKEMDIDTLEFLSDKVLGKKAPVNVDNSNPADDAEPVVLEKSMAEMTDTERRESWPTILKHYLKKTQAK